MVEVKSLKIQQSEATRAALVRTARKLFAKHGYANVSIEDIVTRARMTRGALYHHFTDKADLFKAVLEGVMAGVVQQVKAEAMAQGRPEKHLEAGVEAMLDATMDPEVQRILLIDGPSVVGWDAWREMEERYGLGEIRNALAAAMDADYLEPQPLDYIAPMILSAVYEASFQIARAEDTRRARAEAGQAMGRLLAGLSPGGAQRASA